MLNFQSSECRQPARHGDVPALDLVQPLRQCDIPMIFSPFSSRCSDDIIVIFSRFLIVFRRNKPSAPFPPYLPPRSQLPPLCGQNLPPLCSFSLPFKAERGENLNFRDTREKRFENLITRPGLIPAAVYLVRAFRFQDWDDLQSECPYPWGTMSAEAG